MRFSATLSLDAAIVVASSCTEAQPSKSRDRKKRNAACARPSES
jgi:hypothetical protein